MSSLECVSYVFLPRCCSSAERLPIRDPEIRSTASHWGQGWGAVLLPPAAMNTMQIRALQTVLVEAGELRLQSEVNLPRRLWVTLEPGRPMLPLGWGFHSLTTRHLDLRQTLSVHHFILALDDIVLVKQKRSQRVNLIGHQRPLFTERHAAADVIPHNRRVRRAHRH